MQKKKIMNFRPFFFSAVSVALGICSGYLFYFSNILLGALVTLCFLLLTAVFIFLTGDEIIKKLWFGLAFLLIFIFGATAFSCQVSLYQNANLNGHYYSVTGKVVRTADVDYGKHLILNDVSIKGDRTGALKYGVALYTFGDCGFDIGDVINFSATLTDLDAFYENRLSASDIEQGIKYFANVDATEITLKQKSVNIFDAIHLYMRDALYDGMDQKEAGVAYGLLLGNTQDMDREILTSYRQAGVAHIFAVSGLHIGFLATALNLLLSKCKVNRLAKAIIITLLLFFYSGVCGFSASSLRASVMSSVVLFSSVKGNRYDGLSSVGLAGTLLLICSPINLFCVGFQLSFTVVLGMMLLSPPLSKLLSFLPRKLASSLGAVISAQVVGIPICLFAFGQFSTIAILANLIFIPIVSVIFIFLMLATIIGGIPGVAYIALFLPNHIFKLINIIITAFDYEIFIVGGFTFGIFALFYYLSLILPCGILNFSKMVKLVASIACALICVIGTIFINVNEKSAPKAYVIGSEKVCSTVIKNQGETLLIVSDANSVVSLGRFNRLKTRENIDKIDTLIFMAGQTVDMQVFITRLRTVFELDKVCYFGAIDFEMEENITRSFGLKISPFVDGQQLTAKTELNYALNGYAIECKVNGKRLAIFSEFGNYYADYVGLSGEYDYMLAVDYAKYLDELYQPKQLISFRDSSEYISADSLGTLKLRLE